MHRLYESVCPKLPNHGLLCCKCHGRKMSRWKGRAYGSNLSHIFARSHVGIIWVAGYSTSKLELGISIVHAQPSFEVE